MKSSTSSIDYLDFTSSLGRILLAATSNGLCFLHFCGAALPPDPEIRPLLRSFYPGHEIREGSEAPLLREVQHALLRYLEESLPLPPIPVDLSWGTPFRQRVWKALCRIPFGETRSYQHVAQSLGLPGGARAIGQACAQNPIAIVVPCHRVIATNGKLGGYSGGLEIKKALLDLERQGIEDLRSQPDH